MITIHPNALKHRLAAQDIAFAWDHYLIGAVRVPGEREVRIGCDRTGRMIEMVGALLVDDSWLIYHALTPPSRTILAEIERARRRDG